MIPLMRYPVFQRIRDQRSARSARPVVSPVICVRRPASTTRYTSSITSLILTSPSVLAAASARTSVPRRSFSCRMYRWQSRTGQSAQRPRRPNRCLGRGGCREVRTVKLLLSKNNRMHTSVVMNKKRVLILLPGQELVFYS